MDSNPFGILTFIVAPAILTNASSINVLATTNRLARAIDSAREISSKLDKPEYEARTELHLRLLKYSERRIQLLVRALNSFYASVGAFAAASLISLVGAILMAAHQENVRMITVGVSLLGFAAGVVALVYGSLLLVLETRMALRSTGEEVAGMFSRHRTTQRGATSNDTDSL